MLSYSSATMLRRQGVEAFTALLSILDSVSAAKPVPKNRALAFWDAIPGEPLCPLIWRCHSMAVRRSLGQEVRLGER
jgi:hypothetical protein